MEKNRIVIEPAKIILNTFHESYIKPYTTIVEEGGRTSGKSTFVGGQKLVLDFLKHPEGNVICFRRYQNTLLGSCYTEISKGIHELGLEEFFDFKPSRLRIFHKETGTGFYFFGLDDINKIKSSKVATGYPFRYWFEEFQENDTLKQLDIIEDVIVTFEREKLPKGYYHQTIYSLNRPRNKYHLINVWLDRLIENNDPDVLIHKSTYLDVVDNHTGITMLSPEIHKRIDRVRDRDPETYAWRYLGQAVGEGLRIYNMDLVQVINQLPHGEYINYIDIVVDTGYQVSATTFVAYGITNYLNVVVLDVWYYSPDRRIEERIPREVLNTIQVVQPGDNKKAPSEFAEELWGFSQRMGLEYNVSVATEIVDSADGALRNQYFNDYGRRLQPVRKLKKIDMVERSRTVMLERQLYVMNKPTTAIWLYEMEKYQWKDEDELIMRPENPEVIKTDDHTCDTWQYWCRERMDDIGLRS